MSGPPKGRPVLVTAAQGMWLGLTIAAAEEAGDAAREGGYKLTPDDLKRINAAIREATFWMVLQVADWSAVSDEALEGAARDLGRRLVRELLGPAPLAQ